MFLNKTGRAEVIWPDRLVLDPDRQIVPDQKMRSGIWGRARSNPDLAFFPRSGFRVVLVFILFGLHVLPGTESTREQFIFKVMASTRSLRFPDRARSP